MEYFSEEEQIQPLKETYHGWRFSDIVGMFFIGLFLLIVGSGIILFVFVGDDLAAGEMPAITLEMSYAFIILEVVAFGGAVGLVGLVRRVDWSEAAWLRPMNGQWWWYSILIGFLCIPLVNIISIGTQWLFNIELESNPQLEMILPEGFSWGAVVGMTLMIGVFVPFVEELFFRGVLFPWMQHRWSFLPAALVTSLIFGAFHGPIFLVTSTAVLGFIAAWTMTKSNSLWSAVVIHAINNGIQVILAYLFLT